MFFEQWAEVEMEDINFYIVGPHWYFRPHMGLLTICAQHYEGLACLALYYFLLATLPTWAKFSYPVTDWAKSHKDFIPMRESLTQRIGFIFFVGSMCYLGGTLPCARFFYEEEEGFFGNSFLRVSYQFIYLYLAIVMHWLDRLERFIISLVHHDEIEEPLEEYDIVMSQVLLQREEKREAKARERSFGRWLRQISGNHSTTHEVKDFGQSKVKGKKKPKFVSTPKQAQFLTKNKNSFFKIQTSANHPKLIRMEDDDSDKSK